MISRREALRSTLSFAGAAYLLSRHPKANGFTSANARPRIGVVGSGSRWYIRATGINADYGSAPQMRGFGDYVAICDVDSRRRESAARIVKDWTGTAPSTMLDYRELLDDNSIDIVHISTPDHWHAKIAIEAMLAGKDVYCEKPMTLTIEEGREMCDICKRTGRIVQVGTQQRSGNQFLQAIALIRAGRLGDIKKATCSIGGAPTSPQLPAVSAPAELDWNQWLGPAPQADYHYLAGNYGETKSWSRCHYEFRWWYEYSGGKLTDWGAHHVDIATWGLEKTDTGPIEVNPVMAKHPVDFKDGMPMDATKFNTATAFLIQAKYEDGQELDIRHDQGNGILFEGTKGRIFVNRGRLTGQPVEDLATNPLPANALRAVYKGQEPTNHFRNFFESVEAKREPISDVFSHHRALTTCHLAGIAVRLGRPIQWNPKEEKIMNDPIAQSLVAREARKGFETAKA